jgi:hypothetical protein
MRPREQSLAPGTKKIALGVQNYHGMFAAIENVHVVVSIDRDRCDVVEHPSRRQAAPPGNYFVREFSGAESDCHASAFVV